MSSRELSEEEQRALLPWTSAPTPLPPSPGLPKNIVPVRERVRGMLLGLAIGDSLGNTTEGMPPRQRRRAYGEIRDYLPNRWADMCPVGLPSDDTQLAFWTVESMLRCVGFDPQDLAQIFLRGDRIYGIGRTVTAFLLAARTENRRWYEAG